ncbi:MAG: hypothetical protein GMKNLPBB_00395 [Myxococcota bacterium]|nr:hypothetical protein [Myxococcota bacterium]
MSHPGGGNIGTWAFVVRTGVRWRGGGGPPIPCQDEKMIHSSSFGLLRMARAAAPGPILRSAKRAAEVLMMMAVLSLAACGTSIDVEDSLKDEFAAFKAGAQDAGAGNGAGNTPPAPGGNSAPGTGARPPVAIDRFDYSAWGVVLNKYARPDCFNYSGVLQSAEDGFLLQHVLDGLAAADPAKFSGAAARMAFWINTYNAFTIAAVLEKLGDKPGYRVSDDGFSIFRERRFSAAGMKLSLNMIEHGVLRKDAVRGELKDLDVQTRDQLLQLARGVYGEDSFDVRIHFALNCASVGCPSLRTEPYDPGRLETQLEEQTRGFLNDPVKGAGPNGVSELLTVFYPGDFDRFGGVAEYVKKYNPSADAAKKITYDWALNACK